MRADDPVGLDEFATHRSLLFSIAYEILGSVTDAEDVLSESWLRWQDGDRSEVENPRAYLARIVTRQALNAARSASRRRETYVGPWLPEPLEEAADGDGLDHVLTGEAVTTAMLLLGSFWGRAGGLILIGLVAAAATAATVVAVDQATKAWMVELLQGRDPVQLVPGLLQLRLVRNPGAAFSFATGTTWVFTVIAIVVSIFTILSMLKIWGAMFLGEPRSAEPDTGRIRTGLALPSVALAAVTVLLNS